MLALRGGLGDAGASNDDASYEGAPASSESASSWTLDYYRNKAREFQVSMNALDSAWHAANNSLLLGVDEATAEYIVAWLAEFDSKRWQARTIAEGMNLAAQVVNASGGRFPVLSVPGTLGIPALAIPAASLAAFAAAAAIITWGAQMVSGLNDRLRTAQLLDAQATPEARGALAAEVARTEAARQELFSSGIGALAPLLKWGAIAAVCYVGWRFYKGMRA